MSLSSFGGYFLVLYPSSVTINNREEQFSMLYINYRIRRPSVGTEKFKGSILSFTVQEKQNTLYLNKDFDYE